jgi:glutamyl-tRNA synthetase
MSDSHTKVVTRFAPSPTGKLHCGAYRTAIFSYLYARKMNGAFVLRIEDTDKERSKKEYEDNILDSLSWLGLEHDVFVRQSENVTRHKEVLEKLIKDGHAYVSKEEAKDGSGVIKEIVRFKNPNVDVTFEDEIKGSVTMNTKDLGDFVIAKNINEPLFHLAVVVDDFDEGITHVIRGEDHVSNTPRQILIQRAIGAPTPIYAHLPLVLGQDKQKLSKRKGALAVTEYRDLGYLPEALLNMVTMIGWNPGTEQEIFSREELISAFDLAKVQKSPAMFNPEKLDWLNREYLKKMSYEEQEEYVLKFIPSQIKSLPNFSNAIVHDIVPLVIDHISNGKDIENMSVKGEMLYFFFERPEVDKDSLFFKSSKIPQEDKYTTLANYLHEVVSILTTISEADFKKEIIKEKIWPYAEQIGRGDILWPMRYALSGLDKSPDPFILAEILGKEESIVRLNYAIQILEKQ